MVGEVAHEVLHVLNGILGEDGGGASGLEDGGDGGLLVVSLAIDEVDAGHTHIGRQRVEVVGRNRIIRDQLGGTKFPGTLVECGDVSLGGVGLSHIFNIIVALTLTQGLQVGERVSTEEQVVSEEILGEDAGLNEGGLDSGEVYLLQILKLPLHEIYLSLLIIP